MSSQLATKQLTTLRPTQNYIKSTIPTFISTRPPSINFPPTVCLTVQNARSRQPQTPPLSVQSSSTKKAFIVFARWQQRLTWRGRNIPPPTDNAHTNKTNTNTQIIVTCVT